MARDLWLELVQSWTCDASGILYILRYRDLCPIPPSADEWGYDALGTPINFTVSLSNLVRSELAHDTSCFFFLSSCIPHGCAANAATPDVVALDKKIRRQLCRLRFFWGTHDALPTTRFDRRRARCMSVRGAFLRIRIKSARGCAFLYWLKPDHNSSRPAAGRRSRVLGWIVRLLNLNQEYWVATVSTFRASQTHRWLQ